ncbi:MAG: ADP-forming succinate--CoA ligase subunit beta [Bdellovibrionales bacterium]|nr:ADP-forming succinate--CoA ligase subunit beta [Bdellovibrionales bacterium]
MNIHEHQGKELFRKFGLPVPKGQVAYTADEAVKAAESLGGSLWVVKAQIHAGGRGKGGGVKIAKSKAEVAELAKAMLGMQLVTHQTGPEGKEVKRLLIEEGAAIAKELYLAATLDRAKAKLVVMASTEGGMDIEKVAHDTPEKIYKIWISPVVGLRAFQSRSLGQKLGLNGNALKQFPTFLSNLVKLYQANDCSLAEINPLILTQEGNLVALDAKLNFDDNALFRHPAIVELRDPNEEDANEAKAKQYDLSYISLDGNIGCMVNGAGLAMATMDIIKLEGGDPANFLDVGGGATEEKVREAFKIILGDSKVRAVLVNIFGGIMKCDIIAAGVVGAARELGIKIPVVVRLEGTNVNEGKRILEESGLKLITATGMKEAAQKVVEAAKS